MNYDYIELGEDEFKHEIASVFEIDSDLELFEIQEEVFNILQNREIIESEKKITLNKLKVEEKECFFICKEENDGECFFCVFDNYDKAKNEYDLYVKTKTMKDWQESATNYFEQFCKPGDLVGEDIVEEFLNSVPPTTNREGFVQSGEPYSHKLDIEDNKFKATYTTFEKENGHWVYKGNCFKNKNVDQTYENQLQDMVDEEENEETL